MATRKSGGRKPAAKRSGAKKTATRKSTSKSTARKSTAKSTRKSASKSTARKSTAKSTRKSASKSTARKSTARKTTRTKRAPSAAFMKPMQPSEELGAVIGSRPMPRTEVTKKLWAYIKKNDLQDQKNRRQINADDRLRPVFGGKRQVSMFEMTRLVNDHLENT
jgi:chromatin remodeling complex protein RSC6